MSDSAAEIGDYDMLSDVLAFLDEYDDMFTDDGPSSSTSSGPDSDTAGGSAEQVSRTTDAKPGDRPRTQARGKGKTRPRRLDRYWTKKHEMNRLRDEVEYLANKLELLRQCARSPADIKVTSELGVTIRKVCHWRLANWKRLATHERAMRERAENTNAKLRVLLQYQRQWTGGLNGEVVQAAGALAEISCLEDKPRAVVLTTKSSGRKMKSKMHDVTWGEVLRQLYLEAYAFATGGLVTRIETFNWISASESALRSKPLLEWTTSFPVPRRDPRSAGSLWWEAFQQNGASHGSCEDSHGVHERLIPRMEKTCKWSLLDETNNREVNATSVTVLENRHPDDFWVVAWTTTVYDASGDAVLFRATASIVVTKGDAANAQSCVARAHYRIHDPNTILIPVSRRGGSSRSGRAELISSDAKVAMNNWVTMVRANDHQLQRAFMEA